MTERSPSEVRLEVETSPDGVIVLRGELDFASAHVVPHGWRNPVIDLSGVTFMDSVGLQVLLDLRDAIGEDATLILRNPSRAAERLLDLASVEDWTGVTIERDDQRREGREG